MKARGDTNAVYTTARLLYGRRKVSVLYLVCFRIESSSSGKIPNNIVLFIELLDFI